MKFPAAPESIKAKVSMICPLIIKVTGISNTVDEFKLELTAEGLRDGRVGQVALICPESAVQTQIFSHASLSLLLTEVSESYLHGFGIRGWSCISDWSRGETRLTSGTK